MYCYILQKIILLLCIIEYCKNSYHKIKISDDYTKSQNQAEKGNPPFLELSMEKSALVSQFLYICYLQHTQNFSAFKLILFLTFRCPCPDIRSCPIILAFLILWNLYSSLNFTFITSCNSLLGLLCQDSNSVTQFWPQLFLKNVLVLHLSYIKFRKMQTLPPNFMIGPRGNLVSLDHSCNIISQLMYLKRLTMFHQHQYHWRM